jgi:FkbM family methyltransferase
MATYSQFQEDIFIDNLNLINENSIILDIGANDGITFSNSRLFIEKYKCKAFLLEPTSKCVSLLSELYLNNESIYILPYALSNKRGATKINLGNLMDLPTCVNQVSTLLDEEKKYWQTNRNVEYTQETILSITPSDLLNIIKGYDIDLLSIDTEGMDYFILNELYNNGVTPKFIIFEWNGKQDVYNKCIELLSNRYELISSQVINLIFKLK